MFLKNCWYVGAFIDELTTEPLARTLLNEPVVLFRQLDGRATALEDRCCHRGLPLVHGQVIEAGLQCGYHGLVFDSSGCCVRIPGQDSIPPAARVKSYPLVEQDGVVWIWMGDPAKADPARIVAYPWHNNPEWAYKGKRNEVKAPYGLILDNLVDLSHVGYVHRSTIGGEPDAHSNAEVTQSRTEDSVSVVRWLRNSLPPPTYKQAVKFKGRVDRWSETELKPGILTIYAGAKDVGSGAYDGNPESGFELRSMHAVTPETDRSAHYFWTIVHRVRPDMPHLTDLVYSQIDAAFAEDKIIIESQAARIEQRPLPALLDIKSDAPVVQARRMLANRVEQERQAGGQPT